MKAPVIISIGSGKGGVGKSSLTANIGSLLANKGYKVGFLDADLEGANLHLCLGVRRPKFNLQDYLSGRVPNLSDIAIETIVPGTWLISGAGDILQLANPKYSQKQKIISNLRKINADYILVDLGAGSDNTVVDFFTAFQYGIVISDVLPTAIESAYGFIKNSVVRGLIRLFPSRQDIHDHIKKFSDSKGHDGISSMEELLSSFDKTMPEEARTMREWLLSRKTFLVLNMVKNKDDVEAGRRFSEIVRKYISIKLIYIGYIAYCEDIRKSIKRLKPIMLDNPPPVIQQCFEAIVGNIEALTKGQS